jgi:2-polyprenyl-3-methyl-5-hydroxy-6-metoxy-1,4-benzoquinol methylase
VALGAAFPYAITFADLVFRYHRCGKCRTVFVDPIPDAATFARMYVKATYHDAHYIRSGLAPYRQAAILLTQYAKRGSKVLDYGCGVGHFLQAVKAEGFLPYGVEYDQAAAASAAASAGCPVYTVEDLERAAGSLQAFDVLHLGDVLEHLPDPAGTLAELLRLLKPGALLFVEGPLETNPSPVYWMAHLFGAIKHRLRPSLIAPGVPTHLFRTSAKAQAAFFRDRFPGLRLLEWEVSESGWPYAEGHGVKRRIAYLALALGGRTILGFDLGNRFRAIYRLA